MCIRDSAKNMHDMALRQLEEANKELIEMNDTKKEILYMIGLLYEKLGIWCVQKGSSFSHPCFQSLIPYLDKSSFACSIPLSVIRCV